MTEDQFYKLTAAQRRPYNVLIQALDDAQDAWIAARERADDATTESAALKAAEAAVRAAGLEPFISL